MGFADYANQAISSKNLARFAKSVLRNVLPARLIGGFGINLV
jgi:hypothetical protein